MINERQVSINVDGRPVRATRLEPLLEVTRRLGIDVPTLCHHEALEPGDACRLCLVEVTRDGRTKLVTACNYPVRNGIEVCTASDSIDRHRRAVATLLLARCPDVPSIQALAARFGVTAVPYETEGDTCILCGLCTRVCEAYATSAISVLNRGQKKQIGTLAEGPPRDCVGCGACAAICPTGHIAAQRDHGRFEIWQRSFPLATCVVDRTQCRGCGACEEACPFYVPRVVVQKDGLGYADISTQSCRGCGVCFAACPTGAIVQPRAQRAMPSIAIERSEPKLLVAACGRSNLTTDSAPRLPHRIELYELPCTGGMSAAAMLGALARGYDGVLVLGRHQETCRLDGAERYVRETVERIEALAELVGLGKGRVVFCKPGAGPSGARSAIEAHLAALGPSPLRESVVTTPLGEDLDTAMAVLKRLATRPELNPDGDRWLNQMSLPPAAESGPDRSVLYIDDLPYLDLLLAPWVAPAELGEVAKDALAVAGRLNIDLTVAIGRYHTPTGSLGRGLDSVRLVVVDPATQARLKACGVAAQTIAELLAERSDQLSPVEMKHPVAIDPTNSQLLNVMAELKLAPTVLDCGLAVPTSMAPTKEELEKMKGVLIGAARADAERLVVDGPAELIQYLLLRRQGSWRRTHVSPALISELLSTRE